MDFTTSNNQASIDAMVNVNGSDDPHYRYKMQLIKVKYIALNGETTIIVNASTVAHDIYRELSDLRSCFAKGIAGRVTIKQDELYIPGHHAVQDLQRTLAKYIAHDVLCNACGNPETLLHRKRKRKCQACGNVADSD